MKEFIINLIQLKLSFILNPTNTVIIIKKKNHHMDVNLF